MCEHEAAALDRGQLAPARREDAEDVAVGEHDDVAGGGPGPGDHPVGPRRGLLEGLAVGAGAPSHTVQPGTVSRIVAVVMPS